MMQNYRQVVRFNYKNNYYQMYIDDKCKMFFLKCNTDGSYSYISSEELEIFYTKFAKFQKIMLIKKDKNKKARLFPKVFVKGIALLLTVGTLLTGCAKSRLNKYKELLSSAKPSYGYSQEIKENNEVLEELYDIANQMSSTETEEKEFTLDTFVADEYSRYIHVYDVEYLEPILGYDSVSYEQIHAEIDKNTGVSDKFRGIMHLFATRLEEKQPDADLRVFYENLKTLKIIECDKLELSIQTVSIDSYGCYVQNENTIYVLEDSDYTEGTWDFQVIFHELSHMLNCGNWEKGDKTVRFRSYGDTANQIITDEALNSIFTVSLFNYKERDIAYQLQSNYFSIMTENMDNYKLSDYINHSTSYFAQKLDEYNGDDNYATVMFKLIEAQYNDYHDDDISIEQSEFYRIYDYIADMYYKNHLTSGMSLEEAKAVTAQLIERVTFDVPEEYNIDTNHFYDYLEEYCEANDIIQKHVM